MGSAVFSSLCYYYYLPGSPGLPEIYHTAQADSELSPSICLLSAGIMGVNPQLALQTKPFYLISFHMS